MVNSDIKKIAKWAESQGWTVTDDKKGYTHFYDQDGEHRAYYPATPSNPYRRMKDLQTDLKAAGLQIPPPSKKEQRAAKRKQDETETEEGEGDE